MKRALVLANPKARRAAAEKARLSPALEKRGITVLETSETDPSRFGELVGRLGEHVDLIVAAGGDGTLLVVAAALAGKPLPLGVVPLGTANNLARNLGIPLELEAAADVIAAGKLREIDLGSVNGKPFLTVAGLGLRTQIHRFVPRETKRRWGPLAYAYYWSKLLPRVRPFSAIVRCDGKETRVRSLQITVCNGRYYGARMTIAQDATLDDGRLHLLSTLIDGAGKALRLLPELWTGRYRWENGTRLVSGSEIEVVTSRPMRIDTDGEMATSTPATFRVLPRALRVYTPGGQSPA